MIKTIPENRTIGSYKSQALLSKINTGAELEQRAYLPSEKIKSLKKIEVNY